MTARSPLLCELHAHTDWSDGELSLDELVDLYGEAGFDVLCVTDHVLCPDDPSLNGAVASLSSVDELRHAAYIDAIAAVAERAIVQYGMVVVPGLELTVNHPDPALSLHAVAVGLQEFVSPAHGAAQAMADARAHGAAIIAAHPHAPEQPWRADGRERMYPTMRLWHEPGHFVEYVDRFELFNQCEMYPWIAEHGLPAVASGDFHRPDDLASWKTLVPCEKYGPALVDYLRGDGPVYLQRFAAKTRHRPLVAAA